MAKTRTPGLLGRLAGLLAGINAGPAGAEQLEPCVVETTPALEAMQAACAALQGDVRAGDWKAVAGRLADWDTAGDRLPNGRALRDGAFDAICDVLADGFYEPTHCMPFALPHYGDATAASLMTLAETVRGEPQLRAFAAHVLLQMAWVGRGMEDISTVSPTGWEAATALASRAEALLDRAAADAPASPLVAATRVRLLPFLATGPADVMTVWRSLRGADPAGLSHSGTLAFYLLPRWFGDPHGPEPAIREIAFLTKRHIGLAAYAEAYLSLADEAPGALLTADPALLVEGIDDLAALRNSDPDEIARLYLALREIATRAASPDLRGEARAALQALSVRIATAARRVLRRHLTRVYPPAWNGIDGAAAAIGKDFRHDIARGCRIVMDDAGLHADPLSTDPARA